jgi:hypothetical protein
MTLNREVHARLRAPDQKAANNGNNRGKLFIETSAYNVFVPFSDARGNV